MADCIGCGYCCVKVQCAASVSVYGVKALCPALKWTGTRHLCGLMQGKRSWYYKKELAAGAGCSSPLFNNFRTEVRDRTNKT